MTEVPDANIIHPQVDIPWPSLADSPWPSAHGDMQCTNRSKFTGPREGKVCWTYSTEYFENEISAIVIGEDETIYFSAKIEIGRPYLLALNPDGSLKWKFKLQGINATTPVLGDSNIIYVAASRGPFYAINPEGTEKWKYDLTSLNYTFSPAIGLDGTIYFSDVDGVLYGLNSDGTLKWTTTGKAGIWSGTPYSYSIAISPDGSVLYAGGLDSTLNAMDTNSGDLIWQLSTGSLLITSPLVDSDGNVYFIKRDTTGSVICSASPSGVIRWISDFNVHQWVSLHMDRDGNIFAYGGDHQLVSCDYAGKLRWHRTMLSGDLGVWPVSIIGDCEGQVYFAYGYKYLLAFDKNGNNKFICELPDYSDGLIMGAISSDGHLYLSSKYQLYCIK